jgi:hypothetical protein
MDLFTDLTDDEKEKVSKEINAQLDAVMPIAVEQFRRMAPVYEEIFLPIAEKVGKVFAKALVNELTLRGFNR